MWPFSLIRGGSSVAVLAPDEAALFEREFKEVGVGWALIAGFAAVMIYLVIIIISAIRMDWARGIFEVRMSIVVMLLLMIFLVSNVKDRNIHLAQHLVAFASASTLYATAFIALLANVDDPKTVLAVPSALIFGLFLHYCFLRLPLYFAAGIGWSASVLAVLFAPSALGGDSVRHAVYLAFTNVFGMILCHLIESRERELFFQRGRAVAGWAEASRLQQEAEAAVESKGRLIAAVSHDLRQPMTAASLYLDLLSNRLRQEDLSGARGQVTKAQAAVSMLGGTLDHILASARFDSRADPIQLEWIDVGILLASLSETFAAEASRRGIEFKLRLPRQRMQVHSDRRALERIVSNIVGNALKFTSTREGTRSCVLLSVRFQSGRCLIDVFDTGHGIAASDLDSIWLPYTRVEVAEGDRPEGLGLGLHLVKRLTDQLPGHVIKVRSTPGRGSRFSVLLPARYADSLLHAPSDPEAAHVDTLGSPLLWGAYVLLLEDDRLTRDAVSEVLQEWGVMVLAAVTPKELLALHADSERMVDAIICDYRLPSGLNGFAAIETLRVALSYAPNAILITGEPDLSVLLPAVGRDTIMLQKPLSTDSLHGALTRAVAVANEAALG
jgi:signal transduction histidine kinase/ActR/RegA family two-component response regulator